MKDAKKPAKDKQGDSKQKNRGTSDEFEIITLIINENVGLKARVMEKIRQVRAAKAARERNAPKETKEPA